jgi:hypothetical protein
MNIWTSDSLKTMLRRPGSESTKCSNKGRHFVLAGLSLVAASLRNWVTRRACQPPELFHVKIGKQYLHAQGTMWPRIVVTVVLRCAGWRSQAATLYFVFYSQVSHLEVGQSLAAVSTIPVYDEIRYR